MSSRAKKYNNIKLFFGIGKGIAVFVLMLLFVALGYSARLETYLSGFVSSSYLVLLLFTVIAGAVISIIFFPVSYYLSFYLEHKYELSNQTFWAWIWEDVKGALVGAVIGLPILLLFYYVMNIFGNWWWLPFSAVMFIISVVLAQFLPVVILPLFYKITPIENEEIKERVLKLSEAVGMKVENVYQFNMSKNTKKANAAFTGLGKTKRVLLGDTLLEEYTKDEIETVLAHEFGHYKYNHITKNLILGTVFSFLTYFLIAQLYSISLPWFGFENITTVAALPLLMLWGMLISVIQSPVTNYVSRKFEYQADEYAIEQTGKPDAFINTLDKLTDQNLGDREPHPFVEWYFYSHPSINKRISFIKSLTPAGQVS